MATIEAKCRLQILSATTIYPHGRAVFDGPFVALLPSAQFRKLGLSDEELIVVSTCEKDGAQLQPVAIAKAKPLSGPVLKAGAVGVSELLGSNCGVGAQASGKQAPVVRIVRLDAASPVSVVPASELHLSMSARTEDAAPAAAQPQRNAAATSRRGTLLERAAAFAARGAFLRLGDALDVSFEGRSVRFTATLLKPQAAEAASAVGLGARETNFLAISEGSQGQGHSSVALETPAASPAVDSLADGLEALVITPALSPRAAEGNTSSWRERILAFYAEHNPSKASEVDGILARYSGREPELFAKLQRKYGVPTEAARFTTPVSVGRGKPAPLSGGGSGTKKQHKGSPAATAKGSKSATRDQSSPRVPQSPSEPASEAALIPTTFHQIVASTRVTVSTAPSKDAALEARPDPSASAAFGQASLSSAAASSNSAWSTVGGLAKQVAALREAVEVPLLRPHLLADLGVKPGRGVLLYGPPGTGKTSLARAAAAACGVATIVVNGPELVSRFVGESEAALRRTFERAAATAPCLVVFDEIDALCPRRDAAASAVERRIVSTLLALLDGVTPMGQVVIIACTNRPQALDAALRRPGRLDREIEVGVPDADGRGEILRVALASLGLDGALTEEQESSLAARTHGFVGADLELLVKEAALHALLPPPTATDGSGARHSGLSGAAAAAAAAEEAASAGPRLRFSDSDVEAALALVSPSALREVAVEVPKVRWSDIGGMEDVKALLKEVVEWPLRHPEAFERMGISPPRGVLLYGPPGCSKTLMARALATESGMNFLAVKGPELLSKWLGESERALQAMFRRARAAAPTIIFFDEVDALAGRRGAGAGEAGATERVLTQLLTELDGVEPLRRVVVVAATNRPDLLDPALLRPGRLDRLVYVPPPDLDSRAAIFRIALERVPQRSVEGGSSGGGKGGLDTRAAALAANGFSGAECVAACREAALLALEENEDTTAVEQRHLMAAVAATKLQISHEMLLFYQQYAARGIG